MPPTPTIITPTTTTTLKTAAGKYFQPSTSRKEALSLYREILRTTKAFHWCDERGIPWNARLRKEARKEFEASREERDPLMIAKMLVTGRDCVQKIQQKLNEADRAAWERIERDSSRSR
jgi:Complex 1 protein (LYR family).